MQRAVFARSKLFNVWAMMHGIMRLSVLLVVLILVGLGTDVLGQTIGVTETSSISGK